MISEPHFITRYKISTNINPLKQARREARNCTYTRLQLFTNHLRTSHHTLLIRHIKMSHYTIFCSTCGISELTHNLTIHLFSLITGRFCRSLLIAAIKTSQLFEILHLLLRQNESASVVFSLDIVQAPSELIILPMSR